jgi:hypothetical protein
MKLSGNTPGKILILAVVLFMSNRVNAQPDKAGVKTSVESKQFIFHAQTALPTSGRSRQLTSDYSLRVLPDSLVSNLPFYGRAYSVPYGSGDGGFNFTSTKFEYTASPGKKKGWDISIKPKDVTDFREFSLSLSANGYGTLQVLTNNRQPISFTGYITEIR